MYDYSPYLDKLVDLATASLAVFIVAIIGTCLLAMVIFLWKDDR